MPRLDHLGFPDRAFRALDLGNVTISNVTKGGIYGGVQNG